MIHIESESPFPKKLIEDAVEAALKNQSEPADLDLTVVLTDDAQMQELNRDYLGNNKPTDVLSFPASEMNPETGSRYIGDILISIPYASRSADKAGHSMESEVQLLVAHGVLHLLGHDHAKADEKARMWKAQAEILKALGIDHIKIREE